MANTLILKKSSVAAKVPLNTDLQYGELAINYTDNKIFFKDAGNVIRTVLDSSQVVAVANPTFTGLVTTPAGSASQAGGLRLTSGTVKTTPVAGDSGGIEYNGTSVSIINSAGARKTFFYTDSTYSGTITSGQVTTALGFTPYNATNPSGYTSNVGTVTSVGGTGTVSGLTLSGSVTTSGNLTLGGTLSVAASNFASQTANTVLAAPNGAAGLPTFRALVAADIPTLNQNTTGNATTATTTTNVTGGALGSLLYQSAANTTTVLAGNTTATKQFLTQTGTGTISAAPTWAALASADITGALGFTPYNATNPSGYTSNVGTVTSVGGTGTVSGLSLSGTVTTSGNLTLSGTLSVAASNFASQTANTVLAAPNGAAGVPTFRALVAADIPTLNQSTTGTASNVTGTVAVANGGTGATAAAGARTNLGATTVGANLFTLANPTAVTFLRVNADNTVSTLDAATFRTAIGAGTSNNSGTVTSVGGTGTVSGLSLSGTVTTSGNLTLSGTLSVAASNFASQTANTVLAAPTGVAGVPTFRALVAADIPTLNQNTTGTAGNVTGTVAVANGGTGATTAQGAINALAGAVTAAQFLRGNGTNVVMSTIQASDVPTLNQSTTGTASNVTGTVAVANGGTGATAAAGARTNLGATTVGGNLFTLANPTAITFLRVNADNTVSTLDAATFRTAIGAGTSNNSGTVTSVGGTGTVSGLTLSGSVTTSGNLTLGGTLSVAASNFASQTANTVLAAPNGAAGVPTFRALVAADIPTLNQSTTGTASNVTGTVAVANGGTGSTTASAAATALGLGTGSNVQFNSLGVGTAGSATAGEIRATNNVTAFFSSDRKLKTNIVPINSAVDKVCYIGGKTFDWTDEYIQKMGGEDGYFIRKSDFGVVAQDVEAVFPVATRVREDGTKVVDYEKLCALAFEAIKELTSRLAKLEGVLNASSH